jgi:hypothetical protein
MEKPRITKKQMAKVHPYIPEAYEPASTKPHFTAGVYEDGHPAWDVGRRSYVRRCLWRTGADRGPSRQWRGAKQPVVAKRPLRPVELSVAARGPAL